MGYFKNVIEIAGEVSVDNERRRGFEEIEKEEGEEEKKRDEKGVLFAWHDLIV